MKTGCFEAILGLLIFSIPTLADANEAAVKDPSPNITISIEANNKDLSDKKITYFIYQSDFQTKYLQNDKWLRDQSNDEEPSSTALYELKLGNTGAVIQLLPFFDAKSAYNGPKQAGISLFQIKFF